MESNFWDVKLKCYLEQSSKAFSLKKASIFPVFKDGENTQLFCLSALGQPNLLQLPGMQRLGEKRRKMEKRLKHRERIIRNACINEIAC